MIEKYVIKPAFYGDPYYVSNVEENDILLEEIKNAKTFTTKQEALDFMEGFPYLTRDDGMDVNAFVIELVYFVEKPEN
jgi:hypothetical protein